MPRVGIILSGAIELMLLMALLLTEKLDSFFSIDLRKSKSSLVPNSVTASRIEILMSTELFQKTNFKVCNASIALNSLMQIMVAFLIWLFHKMLLIFNLLL